MKLRHAIDQFIEWKSISAKGSTVTGYAQDLKIFCLLLKNKEIEDVSLDDIMGVLSAMLDAGWTHASLMRKCMALRKLFEFLAMLGHPVIQKDLIPIPRPERKLPRVATEAQYHALLRVIPKGSTDPRHIRNGAIIRLLWDTGLRVGELLSLDVTDLDLTAWKGVVRTEKNRGSRTHRPFFWTEGTNTCLRAWLERRQRLADSTQPALFICCTGHRIGERLHHKGIGEMLRKYSNKAGLDYVNAHSFRHAVGHEIIKNGGSNTDVAQALGHASLLSTFVYTQLSDTDQERRYRRLRG